MLTIDNISKGYGPQVLFRNASFAIGSGERIGLVGPNGTGKSTFFRLLIGDEQPDEGEIRTPKNYRMAQLRQEWLPSKGDTVLEATLREFGPWYRARQSLHHLEKQLAQSADEKYLEQYHEAENQFTFLGGHSVEQSARELLTGLGFKAGQFDRPATQLSGGWRIRCHLAGLLLQQADLLLLDEPTNHLDIESVKWFEEFLQHYPHTFMLISHDRRLVQRLANNILEFAPPRLTLWPGSLKHYEQLKDHRIKQLEATIANKQKEMDRLQDFVRRFRAKATKARQAQNRLKTADHYQKQTAELKESMPVVSRRPASFRLDLEQRLPRRVLEFENAIFGYNKDQPLFELSSCVVERGKKIGIVGVNGVGKSTFLKGCAAELPLLAGQLQRNDRVTVGFFAQHRMEELPGSAITLDYLSAQSSGKLATEVRTLAACLGLSATDLDKRIEVLSGGEKARVSLTRILLSNPGLLLLDEPTSHLDLEACDALTRGLATYEGTLLAVSHNRDFLDSLVDYIMEIQPGEAVLHHGNYSDWLARRSGEELAGEPLHGKPRAKAPTGKKRSQQKRLEAERRQQRSNKLKVLRQQLEQAELNLKRCSEEINALGEKLCLPESPQDPEFPNWLRRHAELRARLDDFEQRWLEISEAFERIDSEG
jgi:ATP-binding cassette subfamily F protein 3